MPRLLLCLAENPTQYDPPLWDRMAQRGQIQPLVWYLRGTSPDDPEIRRTTHWGVPVGQHYSMATITEDEIIPRLKQMKPAPDAVLTTGWYRKASWLAAWASKRRGVPLILPTDNIVVSMSKSKSKRAAAFLFHMLKNRLFDGFLTTGSLGIKVLLRTGVPRWRIATGLYPVDISWWQSRMVAEAEFSRSLRDAAGAGAFVVLAVTKLSERENPLALLQAFALFRKQLPEAYFYLVGDGPLRPTVESRIQELSLQKRVCLCGYVPYQKLAAFYGAADVFVHTPLDEAWGVSMAEAMSCGVPVVSTSIVGSAHDLIVSGKTGELAPPNDPQALSDALKRLADARAEQRSMRAAARERVTALDVDSVSQDIEELIDRLWQKRKAAGRRLAEPLEVKGGQ